MKPITIRTGPVLAGLFLIASALVLVSWDYKQSPDKAPQKQYVTDTIPQKNGSRPERKIRDLDDAINELDNGDLDMEMTKAMKEVAAAMKQIDAQKIQFEVDKAMREINKEDLKKEIEKAMKEVDMEKIQMEVQKAMKEIDMEKLQTEIKESMDKIDWTGLKAELEDVKNLKMDKVDIDVKKIQQEMEKIGPEIKKGLEEAKVEIQKAKLELQEYKKFVDGLNNDGLINKKENYSIQHKDGKLTVNGKEVSGQVYAKYRSFLDKHTKFKISKDGDDFDMDRDDNDNN